MKKTIVAAAAALVCAGAFAQGFGRAVHKPGGMEPPQPGKVHTHDYVRAAESVDASVYDRTPGYEGHVGCTPFALGVLTVGLPYGSNWAICGARLNLGLPGLTAVYEDVYGLDVGLSGETFGQTGGIAVNAFNNTTRDFYGISVAGLWNRTYGGDTRALQVAALFNFAEMMEGVQVGMYNRAAELHGVQVGIYNEAASGGGLQIGLWNDNSNGVGTPLVGFVF